MSVAQKLIQASRNGDIESVQNLLSIKEIDINYIGTLIINARNIQIYSHFWNLKRIFKWIPLIFVLSSKPNIEINLKSIL